MRTLNRRDFPGVCYPTHVVQLGEDNFLRAFVNWQPNILNEQIDLNAGVTIARSVNTDFPPSLNTQDGLYITLIHGLNEQGEVVSETRFIRSVNNEISSYQDFAAYLAPAHNADIRFLFSNVTEAGISYHAADRVDDEPLVSFLAKLTCLLLEHSNRFADAVGKDWVIIPCELIDHNGEAFRTLVLRYAQEWQLPPAFVDRVETAGTFCSTLVGRIVTGYPREEAATLETTLGYHDVFLDTAEHFYLFVIQESQWLAEELKLTQCPLNIRVVSDIRPYKECKVVIFNGAHTALVPIVQLCRSETVGKAMQDAGVRCFVGRAISEEIIPVLDLPADELREFANAVSGRFQNPYIRYQLLPIVLNGMTKSRTRILPQLLAGQHNERWPVRLTFVPAALLAFYHVERDGKRYPIQDDEQRISLYASLWPRIGNDLTLRELVDAVLGDAAHWGGDLTLLPGLAGQMTANLEMTLVQGMRQAVNGPE